MQRFEAAGFADLSAQIGGLAMSPLVRDRQIPPTILPRLLEFRERFSVLGMRLTAMLLDRIIASARHGVGGRPMTEGDLADYLPELHSRMVDELDIQVLLRVEHTEYFEQDTPFGESVCAAFPSLHFDAREAGNCLALGRHTACVMHLGRVMESALKVFGRALAVDGVEHLPSWDAILSKIDGELARRHKDKSPGWAPHEPFFAEAAAFLRTVQKAWRNPAMHADQRYDYEQARDIYRAVGAFLAHLAKEVREAT